MLYYRLLDNGVAQVVCYIFQHHYHLSSSIIGVSANGWLGYIAKLGRKKKVTEQVETLQRRLKIGTADMGLASPEKINRIAQIDA